MKALLLIDLQIDFCSSGVMEVPEGDQVIGVANQLMEVFDLVVATQDWHPADHKSFAANHPWRHPGQVIEWEGLQQILWPIHCVQHSFGAMFHPRLHRDKIDKIIYKGAHPDIDSYSGFFDNGYLNATELEDYLKAKKVTELYIMGLATDYCVGFTALDALKLNFKTFVIGDGCRGINLKEGDAQAMLERIETQGGKIIQSKILLNKNSYA